MTEPEVDYAAVFRALPGAVALVTPKLIFVDVNAEFMRILGCTREQFVGHFLLENRSANEQPLVLKIMASLRRVADTRERDTIELQRFDMEDPDQPGVWHERYFNMTNIPVLAPDGQVALLLHRVEDVTELVRAREVALTLQEAMLPAPRPVGRHPAAVRYRPATEALNVAGDWYDLVDLPGDRIAVVVGDVVGHGLSAACVMGQLRSALTAVCLVAEGPARALEVLGLYARTVDGAENTTVATAFIDWENHTITYSSAGHPPPVLLQRDGTVEFLDQATDPPLGVRPQHAPRMQAAATFREESALVLYTDGLIERRCEDIDTGLSRLAESLTRHQADDPETLADAVLTDLLPPGGATDDTALVIARL
ncbi:SpoIIE family protein phosphatase [Streptomyces sp. S1A1-8]|uniref:PP2C family protein-serine/threonine phosphatase n=1 Tax=unclassified Streptomyces TaxID=2593676 RepID=UPI001163A146|nr:MULTISPECIES: SpoIIE family protein phosphatase [unclassified Streptomyces]QDN95974.1 SpoIIE family protein phosphatase [Streptomyces sp. RLB1-9]QDO17695.1 SpoIIE family protein phosphatase [Streptomyces sp. S1A1-8]QDO27821.1 SpoIIE family protein phosphatase [Streptomyces sp. S1A1-3]